MRKPTLKKTNSELRVTTLIHQLQNIYLLYTMSSPQMRQEVFLFLLSSSGSGPACPGDRERETRLYHLTGRDGTAALLLNHNKRLSLSNYIHDEAQI